MAAWGVVASLACIAVLQGLVVAQDLGLLVVGMGLRDLYKGQAQARAQQM